MRIVSHVLAAWLVLCASTAFSQTAETKYYDFDISQATLGSALLVLAQQVGAQLLVPSDLARTKGVHPLVGRYKVSEALDLLLRDTGFSGGLTARGVITISRRNMGCDAKGGAMSPEAKKAASLFAFVVGALTAPSCHAQGADSEQATVGLENIIVTARKVKEAAQSTPVTVSVFSGLDIDRRQLTALTDIARISPGVYVQQGTTNAYSAQIGFRGQFNDSALQTLAPAIAAYQDGVYLGNLIGFQGIGLLDVERVEVLKGPQGTLYGRNTSGGAMAIYTKQPTDRFEGEAMLQAGNLGMFGGHGIVNIPLVAGKAALRVVGSAAKDNGYARDVAHDAKLQDQTAQFYRGTLRLTPTPALDISFSGEYGYAKGGGRAYTPLFLDPTGSAVNDIAAATGLSTAGALALYNNTYKGGIGGDKRKVAYTNSLRATVSEQLYTLNVAYDLGQAQIKSITGYRRATEHPTYDFDGTPFNGLNNSTVASQVAEFHQWTQEIDLIGAAFKDKLRYAFGAYYLDLVSRDYTNPLTFGDSFPAANPGTLESRQHIDSKALFGQVTYAILPTLDATGGLRFTEEKKSVRVQNFTPLACNVPPPAKFPGASCVGTFPFSENNVSWTYGLSWKPIPQVMIYAKADRGFRTGGINGRTSANPLSVTPFASEVIDSYEVGEKADLFANRLRINVDYFHLKANGLQNVVLVLPPGGGAAASIIQNAATGIVEGVEAEAAVTPIDGLLLQASAAFTEPKYKQFRDPATGTDLSGRAYALVSKWTYSILGAYTIPLSFGDLTMQADWFYKSRHNLYPVGTHPQFDWQPGYGVVNGQLSLDMKSIDLKISIWAKNIADKEYVANVLEVGGFVSGSYGALRTFGGTILKRF